MDPTDPLYEGFFSFLIAFSTHLELVLKPLVSGEPEGSIPSKNTMKKPKDFLETSRNGGIMCNTYP